MHKRSKSPNNPASPSAEKILAELVSFSYTSDSGNSGIIDYIEAYLETYGVKPHILKAKSTPTDGRSSHTGSSGHSSPTITSDQSSRYNLFATIGPERDGGVLLSGHTDVVPAAPLEWHDDPFTLREEGGRLYGRGSTDMKGFLACILSLVPHWLSQKRSEPIHIACTYDEESGCLGVKDLIPLLGSTLPRPDAVLVGEPTELAPVFGHKGATACVTTVKGSEAHSSRPDRGVNAIYGATEIIAELRRIAEGTLSRGADNPQAALFDPPCTTVSVGTIQGGTARNIVAGECKLEWEIRTLPWESAETYIEDFESFCREHFGLSSIAPAVTTQVESSYPGLIPEKENRAFTYYRRMAGAQSRRHEAKESTTTAGSLVTGTPGAPETGSSNNGTPSAPYISRSETGSLVTGTPGTPETGSSNNGTSGTPSAEAFTTALLATAPFGTEAGRYSEAGIPALVWGPGSIAQAHTKNEYIEKQQLDECRRYLARL